MTDTRGPAGDAAPSLIPAALDRFGDRVHEVPGDRWDAPTPCTEWSVRDLLDHLTTEHLWAPHLLAGETMVQVGDRYDGDVLGSEPVATWARVGAASRPLWRRVDPAATVHVTAGEIPVVEYANQMLLDLTVHGWDLARGAGLDETMDPVAVDHVLAYARRSMDVLTTDFLFAPPVDVRTDDAASQLLALLGRRP